MHEDAVILQAPDITNDALQCLKDAVYRRVYSPRLILVARTQKAVVTAGATIDSADLANASRRFR